MIRYPITDAELVGLIDARDATWRARAQARTAALTAAGKYVKASEFWSDIKLVFMRLQHFKCVFCERAMAGEAVGAVEHDVEHFRPKGRATVWPKPRAPQYAFGTGPADAKGYYWLAYDLGNYAAACKPCNSTLKSDAFPIAAPARGAAGMTAHALLKAEKPFLIYPIGDTDEDPEDVLTFAGILAEPRAKSGHRRRRAEVMIDFFRMNTREELWHGRFHVIRALFDAYAASVQGLTPQHKAEGAATLVSMTDPSAPHASCARRYLEQIRTDAAAAWTTYEMAKTYLSQKIQPPG